jgi:F0F1-type ATP synthase assembly protein I
MTQRSPQEPGDSGHDRGSGVNRPAGGSTSKASSSSELAGMGVQFVVAILLCLFIGKWLDARLGTAPWLLILGVFVGAAASTIAMYRKAFPPDSPKPPADPNSPRA